MDEYKSGTGLRQGISIVLPALNEEQNIEDLVDEIRAYFSSRQIQYEIIIVDDGSTDKTGQIADRLSQGDSNISIIHHSVNKGYGKSLRDGFQAAKYGYPFYTDADKQFKISSLDKFQPFLEDGGYDMIIGYRVDRQDIFLRKFLAWGFNKIVSILFSLKVKDIDCAFKLFKRTSYRKLVLTADDFLIDTEMLVRARLHRFKFTQVGVKHYPRARGESTVSFKHVLATIKGINALYWDVKKL
jgi:glycosyltransferase involved in cell wall biosynthesis